MLIVVSSIFILINFGYLANGFGQCKILIFNVLFINELVLKVFWKDGENSNSCVDSCGADGFKSNFKIDLRDGKRELIDTDLVEILQDNVNIQDPGLECSKNSKINFKFFLFLNNYL